MPKVRETSQTRGRKEPPPPPTAENELRLSSIVFGLAMLAAFVVAAAAWMGGSLSKIESRLANAADGAARAAGLSVERVTVVGLTGELSATVRDAARIEPGENMFRADPRVIRERVEATRRVVNVRVHRLWPDQIVLIADPVEPIALWLDGENWRGVDALGRVVRAPEDARGLVVVAGPGAPEASPALVRALLAHRSIGGLAQRATRAPGGRWDIAFASGTEVRLPADDDLGAALSKLAEIHSASRVLDGRVSQIDLRGGLVALRPARAGRDMAGLTSGAEG